MESDRLADLRAKAREALRAAYYADWDVPGRMLDDQVLRLEPVFVVLLDHVAELERGAMEAVNEVDKQASDIEALVMERDALRALNTKMLSYFCSDHEPRAHSVEGITCWQCRLAEAVQLLDELITPIVGGGARYAKARAFVARHKAKGEGK